MSNKTKIKLTLYSLYIIGLFIILNYWYKNSFFLLFEGTSGIFLALGRISGLLAVYSILFQLMLIGRIKWIERIFGHDKLSQVHHINGLFVWLFIMIHPILIITSYSIANKVTPIAQLKDLILNYPGIPFAFTAYIIFMISIFMSINLIRKKIKYQYWLGIHLFIYIAILLAFSHQLKLGGDFSDNFIIFYWYFLYGFVIANFTIFRLVIPLYTSYKQDYTLEKIVKENYNVHSFYIKARDKSKLNIQGGQFMIFRFLAKGFWHEAHPFSISHPNLNNEIRITVKSVGDFTSSITSLKPGTKIIIEGPYGVFTKEKTSNNKLLFIAGGIGITPLRSILEEISKNKDNILIYSNKTKEDIVLQKELDSLSNNGKLKIHYWITEDPSKSKSKFLDLNSIKNLVSDIQERDVYICGPPPMMKSLRIQLISYGIPKQRIYYEKFSLG